MDRPKLAVRLYTIAGILWLLVGVVDLLVRANWVSTRRTFNNWHVVFSFAMGVLFISLAWQQAKKTPGH